MLASEAASDVILVSPNETLSRGSINAKPGKPVAKGSIKTHSQEEEGTRRHVFRPHSSTSKVNSFLSSSEHVLSNKFTIAHKFRKKRNDENEANFETIEFFHRRALNGNLWRFPLALGS